MVKGLLAEYDLSSGLVFLQSSRSIRLTSSRSNYKYAVYGCYSIRSRCQQTRSDEDLHLRRVLLKCIQWSLTALSRTEILALSPFNQASLNWLELASIRLQLMTSSLYSTSSLNSLSKVSLISFCFLMRFNIFLEFTLGSLDNLNTGQSTVGRSFSAVDSMPESYSPAFLRISSLYRWQLTLEASALHSFWHSALQLLSSFLHALDY